jgi:antitoxin (DNA-binding transcriptional repressor) of toxin-antitoxin stability system
VKVTASQLRQNVYRLLDEVLDSGVPLEIERRGKLLRVVPVPLPNKLERLVPHHQAIVGDPEDFVHLDWSNELRDINDID